jgi:hypothetical protein
MRRIALEFNDKRLSYNQVPMRRSLNIPLSSVSALLLLANLHWAQQVYSSQDFPKSEHIFAHLESPETTTLGANYALSACFPLSGLNRTS